MSGTVSTVLDEQKCGVDKEAGDLRASLRDVEKARLDGRRVLHDLKRQLRSVEAERSRLSQELGEQQVRAVCHDQQMDNTRRDNDELKQKVIKTKILVLVYFGIVVRLSNKASCARPG